MNKIILPTILQYSRVGGVTIFQNLLVKMSQFHAIELIDLTGKTLSVINTGNTVNWFSSYKRKAIHVFYLLFYNFVFPKQYPVFFQISLDKKAVVRDVAYMKKCIHYKRDFAVFIHGWNEEYANFLDLTLSYKVLVKCLNEAFQIWTLSNDFKNVLIKWGVKADLIQLETTMVDDELLDNVDLTHKKQLKTNESLKVLFMSRIVKEKGIFETLEAFRQHQILYPGSQLTIAGEGRDYNLAQSYMTKYQIPNVVFTGFVSGKQKIELLTCADVLILPSHSEGLPISVVEAMAFGCVVLTRLVGGLKGMFINEKMGMITQSSNPEVFAGFLNQLSEHPEKLLAISEFNRYYAVTHLLASVVCRRIFGLLKTKTVN